MYNISSTIYLYCWGICGYSSVGEIICQCSPACKNLVQELNHEMNDEMQKKKKKKKTTSIITKPGKDALEATKVLSRRPRRSSDQAS